MLQISDLRKQKRKLELKRNEVKATLEETENSVGAVDETLAKVQDDLEKLLADAEAKIEEKQEWHSTSGLY